MTPTEFKAILGRHKLSQRGLKRLMENMSDETIELSTINRWATGDTRIPAAVGTMLALMGSMTLAQIKRISR